MDASVTDWLQTIFSGASLIITLAGIYYVAATLREQSRVNEAQFKLLDIESRRAAKEFRPTLSVISLPYTAIAKPVCMDRAYAIVCKENTAYGVCIEHFGPAGGAWFSDNMLLEEAIGTILPDHQVMIVLTFVGMMGSDIPIRVHYLDEIGHAFYLDYSLRENDVALLERRPFTPYPEKNVLNKNASPLTYGKPIVSASEFPNRI